MKYQDTIDYLYGLQKFGMKFGLDNITLLLSSCGNPHRSLRTVHVAGTNGKGSTAAMIESILRNSGLRTGLFTSPHLVSFTERIRINGEEISEADVVRLAAAVRDIAGGKEDFCPTFFEVVTAMAFLHFREREVEWAIIETGLGGRLDATNVILPEVAVITSIGFDHKDFLGGTLRDIAGEKAGIIKERVPLVTAEQPKEVMDVLALRAKEKGSPFYRYGCEFSAELVSWTDSGIRLNYTGSREYNDLEVGLAGRHQVLNAALAVKAAEIVGELYPELTLDVRKGLSGASWPGRLEMARKNPPVIIDGAHNPHAAAALARHIKEVLLQKYPRVILIAGIMADKDIRGILEPLLPLATEVIFAAPAYGRAAAPEALSSYAEAMGFRSRGAASVAEAVSLAERLALPGDLIVITGSFYTIGEAKELLGGKGVLSRLRE